jgi:hypothetical protein
MGAAIEELERSLPRGSSGAPIRARTHYTRILALLRERGAAGVLGSELYDAPHLYGRSPRNRISKLRQDGHLIEGKPRGSDWHYVLIREDESPAPHRPQPRRAEQLPLASPILRPTPDMRETIERVERNDFYEQRASDSPDWFTQSTGQARAKVSTEILFLWERPR